VRNARAASLPSRAKRRVESARRRGRRGGGAERRARLRAAQAARETSPALRRGVRWTAKAEITKSEEDMRDGEEGEDGEGGSQSKPCRRPRRVLSDATHEAAAGRRAASSVRAASSAGVLTPGRPSRASPSAPWI
jgi:hypothetical protein